MFGIGMSEMLIILAVALLVFGPTKLPEIAKSIAKGLKELRRAGDDLRASVNFDLDDDKPVRRPPARAAAPALEGAPAALSGGDPRTSAERANAAPEPPASIPGSELAGTASGDVWPKPADGTTARGEALEAADAPAAAPDVAAPDPTKVH